MALVRRPFVINASAAGLAKKAAKIGAGTYLYVRSIRKSEDNIIKFRNEFRNLDRDLGIVEAATNTLGKDSRKALQESFDGLEKMMDQVIEILPQDPAAQTTKEKLKWPFTKKKTEEILADMERYKTSINMVLSAEGLVRNAAMARDLENLVLVSQRLEASYEIKRNAESRLSGLRKSQGDLNRYFLPEETPAFFRATRGHLESTVKDEGGNILRELSDVRKTHKKLTDVANSGPNHPGPYLSLLQTPAYQAWLKTPSTSLFIVGPRGEGKTALAHNLVRQLPSTLQSNEILVSYFLRERERQAPDLASILRALAVQLAYQSPAAKTLATEFVKQHSSRGRLTADIPALQRLIATMADTFQRVIILANGIDEPPPNSGGESLLPVLNLAHLSTRIQMVAFGRRSPSGLRRFRDVDMSILLRDSIHDIVRDKLKDLGVEFRREDLGEMVEILNRRFGKQGLIGYRFAFELLQSFLLSSEVEQTADQVKMKIREICNSQTRKW